LAGLTDKYGATAFRLDFGAARFSLRRCGRIYHGCARRQFGALHPATSHQAGALELSERLKIESVTGGRGGCAADTVVDAELWLILAAMIGWIVLGCFLTARHHRHAPRY
jgi:hypothetical protein